jgi:predicted glycosyltransferase
MDVLAARCRAVIAPYAGGKETEQTERARLLSADGPLQVVWEEDLSAAALADAVEAAMDAPRPDASAIRTDGAVESARILGEMAGQAGSQGH